MAAYGGLHCPDILTKYYGQIYKRNNKSSLSGQFDRIYHTDKHTNGQTKIVRRNTQISKQSPDKHTKGANKLIDRQKDGQTDYSNFNIDEVNLQAK